MGGQSTHDGRAFRHNDIFSATYRYGKGGRLKMK